MPENQPSDVGAVDDRPALVIPYWTAPLVPGGPPDDGSQRPLPAPVVSWLCPAIRALTPYQPGAELTVQVDIVNWGLGNATALPIVTVWWMDPSTGFAAMGPSNRVGLCVVPVDPRGGTASTPPMTTAIPPTAPPHVCLLAYVSHPDDQAGSLPDPIGDRHWAQHNLAVVTVQPGQSMIGFSFWAVSPYRQQAVFEVRVRPVTHEALASVARIVRAEPVRTEVRLALREAGEMLVPGRAGADEKRRDGRLQLALEGGARRPIYLQVELGSALKPGQFTAVEVVQLDVRRERATGSVGVVVTTRAR